ncbi:MAG: TetR/AcrR family transcriptional regulator [Pseudomonadota bacterium]
MPRPNQARERVLDAAAELLASRGLKHLNTNALATQAGVTPPTVYRYFNNKEAVVIALAERFIEAEKAWLADAETELHQATDAATAACLLIDQYWLSARQQRGIVALRGAMRVWPELKAIEEASLVNSTKLVSALLGPLLPAHSKRDARRISRYIVELVCSTVDRCYPLADREQTWRMKELKQTVTAYLRSHA